MAVMTDAFIEDMLKAAANLGQFFCGVPEEDMIDSLYDIEADLENGLQQLGVDVAALISETFCATVILHRREIEAAGETPPVVLN
jgi:hypothetical protein